MKVLIAVQNVVLERNVWVSGSRQTGGGLYVIHAKRKVGVKGMHDAIIINPLLRYNTQDAQ
jgi:hypothetical protein